MLVKVYFKNDSWVIRDHSGQFKNQILGYAKEILLKDPDIHTTHFVGHLQQVCSFFKVQTAPNHPYLLNLQDQFLPITEGSREAGMDFRLGYWFEVGNSEPLKEVAFVHLAEKVTFDTHADVGTLKEGLKVQPSKLKKLFGFNKGVMNVSI